MCYSAIKTFCKFQNSKLTSNFKMICFYSSETPGFEMGRIVTSQFPLNLALNMLMSVHQSQDVEHCKTW